MDTRERKEVDICTAELKEEELLDSSEGGGRVLEMNGSGSLLNLR